MKFKESSFAVLAAIFVAFIGLSAVSISAGRSFAQEPPAPATGEQAPNIATNPGATGGDETQGIRNVDVNAAITGPSFNALIMIFVLATVLENALAVLFNWRLFLAYFDRRGIKTLVTVASALLLVNAFGIDIVAALVTSYKSGGATGASEPHAASLFVTALTLAGGSAGVNSLFRGLGWRPVNPAAELETQPNKDEAWLAIKLKRANARGPVQVRLLGPVSVATGGAAPAGAAQADGASQPAPTAAIAGIMSTSRPGLGSLLFRNPDRFPQNGGYRLEANKLYELSVIGRNADGDEIFGLENEKLILAPRAIVDIDVTL